MNQSIEQKCNSQSTTVTSSPAHADDAEAVCAHANHLLTTFFPKTYEDPTVMTKLLSASPLPHPCFLHLIYRPS